MEVYFDNSATTRQYDEVSDLMCEVAKNTYGNPSSLHRTGLEAEKLLKASRKKIATGFNAKDEEIFITACGTESDNTVLMGAAQSKGRVAKKIITTQVEHPAILEPCKRLEQMGYEVVYIGVDNKCRLNLEQLKNEIDQNTCLISVMAVNNEAGTIMPIPEIGEIKAEFNRTHGTDILLHTDAVQAFGKISCDTLKEFKNVDMISASAHKIHGPKGVGALYVRKGVNIRPFLVGGGQERGFRSGTENVPGIAGFGLATEMAMKNFEKRTESMRTVRNTLKTMLTDSIPDILINSPDDGVCSVLNVSFLGTRGEVILHTLEQDGIYVSTGSACSSNHASSKGSHVLNAMGLKPKEIEGAIRFSFSEFNTEADCEYTAECVKKAVTRFRKLGAFR